MWLRYVGRSETDQKRQASLLVLGSTLSYEIRLKEALAFQEQAFAMMRRLYGPEHPRAMMAEEELATTLRKLGGAEGLRRRRGADLLRRRAGRWTRRAGARG